MAAGQPPSSLPPETIEFAHRMFDAARAGDEPLLLQAVDRGLPANLTNPQGVYQILLKRECHVDDAAPRTGNTLLMLAAYAGHPSLVRALLARDADPNRINDRGQSILAGAVFKAHDEIARDLVAAGANARLGSPTAIETAHMFGRKDLLDVLGAEEGDIGENIPTPPSALPRDAAPS